MSDDIKKEPEDDTLVESPASKYSHLTPVQAENAAKAAEKIALTKKLREISGGGKWTITQSLLQEVIARRVIIDPKAALPKIPTLVEELKIAIEEAYKEDVEMQDFLKETLPQINRIRLWLKAEGWDEAVWSKIRDTGMFTKERRAAMINALYQRGIEKDTVAAKIWLTMSGDFVEKSQVDNKDSTLDKFREINSILHNKKKTE